MVYWCLLVSVRVLTYSKSLNSLILSIHEIIHQKYQKCVHVKTFYILYNYRSPTVKCRGSMWLKKGVKLAVTTSYNSKMSILIKKRLKYIHNIESDLNFQFQWQLSWDWFTVRRKFKCYLSKTNSKWLKKPKANVVPNIINCRSDWFRSDWLEHSNLFNQ